MLRRVSLSFDKGACFVTKARKERLFSGFAEMNPVFGHGKFSMGLLGTAITDYVGVGNLKSYKVRFTRQTWPGEVLVSTATVIAKRVDDGEHLVDISCRLSSETGEVKVDGEAVATLPVRS